MFNLFPTVLRAGFLVSAIRNFKLLILILISPEVFAQVEDPMRKTLNKYEDVYSAKPIQIDFSKEESFDPYDYRSFIFKAEENIESGDYDEAITELKKAAEIFNENYLSDDSKILGKTKDERPGYLIAYCFVQLNDYDSAIHYLDQCIKDQPLYLPAYNLKGFTYLLKADTFRTEWRNLQLRNYDLEKSFALKRIVDDLDEKALTTLKKGLALNPENPNTLHTLGFACYITGARSEAMKYINKNIKLNKDYLKTYKLKADIVGYVNAARMTGVYDRAVNNNIVNPDAYFMRGLHYLSIRKFNRAEEDITKALWMKGDSSLGMYAFSLMNFMQSKDMEAIPWVISFYQTNGFMHDSKTYYQSDFERMAHIEILRHAKKAELNELDKMAFGNYEKGLFLRRRIIPEYNKLLNSNRNEFDSTIFFRKTRSLHLYSLNDKKVNLNEIDLILKSDSSNAFRLLKGKYLYQNEMYEEAKAELSFLLNDNDKFLYARYYLAMTQKETGNYREALRLLDKCIEDDPDAILFKIEKAHCLHLSGSSELSLEILHKLKNTHTKNPYVLSLMGEIYLDNGDDITARSFLSRSLKLDSFFVKPFILKARQEARQKNYIDAKKHYDNALQRDPDNVLALKELGDLYLGFERYEEAKRNYYECTLLRKVNPLYKLDLALAYSKLGEFDKAMKMCEEAERLKPNSTLSLETYGKIYLDRQMADSAVNYFSLAYKKDPLNFKEHRNYALALYLSGQYIKAEKMSAEAIEKRPFDLRSQLLLAITKLNLDKFEEARSLYSDILSNPKLDKSDRLYAKSMLQKLSPDSGNSAEAERILKEFFN